MPLKSLSVRLLITVLSVGFLWLSAAAPSAAAPAPAPGNDSATDINSRAISGKLKKLVRQSRLIRGPVARRFRLALFDLKHGTPKMGRVTQSGVRDEDQAIQNDAPATAISADLFVELQPLGFSVETLEQTGLTVVFSPRSPRGPPTHA